MEEESDNNGNAIQDCGENGRWVDFNCQNCLKIVGGYQILEESNKLVDATDNVSEDTNTEFVLSLHDTTLENNLATDSPLTILTNNIGIDNNVWLENNDVLNVDVRSCGKVDIVSSKNDNKNNSTNDVMLKKKTLTVEAVTRSVRVENSQKGIDEVYLNKNIIKEVNKNLMVVLKECITPPKANRNISKPEENSVDSEIQKSKDVEYTQRTYDVYQSPKHPESAKRTLIQKKTPTVAISDEFVEYQRRLQQKKEKAAEKKLKRLTKRKMLITNKENIRKKRYIANNLSTPCKSNEENSDKVFNKAGTDNLAFESNFSYNVGNFVVISYNDEYFPGSIYYNPSWVGHQDCNNVSKDNDNDLIALAGEGGE
ncbi:hypothetical protein FQA39_LY10593 [Lamprigera yunnana]|nr:hypothetical protein FQA39_LY10593 [Lamprigera yunnana]